MTKAEQARLWAWRCKVLKEARGGSRRLSCLQLPVEIADDQAVRAAAEDKRDASCHEQWNSEVSRSRDEHASHERCEGSADVPAEILERYQRGDDVRGRHVDRHGV